MPSIAYVVTAHLPNTETKARYLEWLVSGHVQAVLAAGAHMADVVALDDPVNRVQSRYMFPDAASLSRYLVDHAPALKADGMRIFGGSTGVSFTREIGAIVWSSSNVGG